MKLTDYKKENEKTNAKDIGDEKKKLLNALKSFEGKSEDELIKSILAVATKKRAEGTLTDGEIETFRKMIEPGLNKRQRAKLEEVVNLIKNS